VVIHRVWLGDQIKDPGSFFIEERESFVDKIHPASEGETKQLKVEMKGKKKQPRPEFQTSGKGKVH